MKTSTYCFLPVLCLFLLAARSHASPLLVSTDWLAKNMENANIVLIDMSDGMQYSRFHLPGARHLPYSAINQQTKSGIIVSAGNERIAQILGLLGIDNSRHIVVYDDMAGLNAARLFWELERLGHQKQSILDGGLVKWVLEGRKVTNKPADYQKSRYQPNPGARDNLASLDEIRQAGKNKALLLDVRSKEEYIGNPAQKRSGHIPGAKWWEWEQAGNFEQAFTMQPEARLRKSLSQLGLVKPDSKTIVYCQTGHRAAHTYFTLRRLGFTNIRLFDGSMAEYSQSKHLSIQQGPDR